MTVYGIYQTVLLAVYARKIPRFLGMTGDAVYRDMQYAIRNTQYAPLYILLKPVYH